MKIQHLMARVAIVFCCIFAASAGAASAQKADPAEWGALPAISSIDMSPDGKTVAVLQNNNETGESYVVFFDLENPDATPKGVGVGDAKAHRIAWVDDEYLLLLTSVTGNAQAVTGLERMEFFRWIAISKDDRKLKILFQRDANYYISDAGKLLSTNAGKPNSAIMARMSSDSQVGGPTSGLGARFNDDDDNLGISIFRVNMKSGSDRILHRGNRHTDYWIVDSNGEARIRVDYDTEKEERQIFRRRGDTKAFQLIASYPERHEDSVAIRFHGMGDSPSEVIATYYGTEDKRGVVVYDLDETAIQEPLIRPADHDIDYVTYNPHTGKVEAAVYTDDMPVSQYFDEELAELHKKLSGALPNASLSIDSHSIDNSRMIIKASYTDRPDEFYIFHRDNSELAFFSSARPSIADHVYATNSKYEYTAPDGLNIEGYLTTPAGAEKQNLPLIVLPHGPEGRDDMRFWWLPAFYAARGYAVYQPNYRGSSGYGLAFREAGYGEWGRKMQDDITNGVKKLIADGIADPERVCIVGYSVGGYAALAGATLTPDLYNCAVSVNGISNLPALLGEAGRQQLNEGVQEYWEERIGGRTQDEATLKAVSPSENAGRVKAPIMLIHGKDDTRVPFYQSEMMSTALANAGKEHILVELDGGDHWLSTSEMRIEVLRRSIEFIDQEIGN